MKYPNGHNSAISFPLGGIGTGSIGLSGAGQLIDWEIMNRPDKGSHNGYSHLSVKAERGGELVDVRVLNGDMPLLTPEPPPSARPATASPDTASAQTNACCPACRTSAKWSSTASFRSPG